MRVLVFGINYAPERVGVAVYRRHGRGARRQRA